MVKSFDEILPTRDTLFLFLDLLDEVMSAMAALVRYRRKFEEYARSVTKKIAGNNNEIKPFEFDEPRVSPKAKDIMFLSGLETTITSFSNSFRISIPTFYELRKKYYEMVNTNYSFDDLKIIGKCLGLWRWSVYTVQNYVEYSNFYMKQVNQLIDIYDH